MDRSRTRQGYVVTMSREYYSFQVQRLATDTIRGTRGRVLREYGWDIPSMRRIEVKWVSQ